MENFMVFGLFLLGLVLIIKGGDLFVEAAVWIANVTGLPPILIGATIVSLATTLPELFVSVIASMKGYPDMAIGNAIGSCICNIGLVLGVSACIAPIPVRRRFFSIKAFIMMISLLAFFSFAFDQQVSSFEGILLLILLFVYICTNLLELKYNTSPMRSSDPDHTLQRKKVFSHIIQFILGAILIVIGAQLLVNNGVKIAEIFRVPQQIVSLTLIALGTSLPELTTSLVATLKGHQGISVGNIIGANILNLTMVLGSSAIVSKQGLIVTTHDMTLLHKTLAGIPQTLVLDIPIAFLLMVILLISSTFLRMIDRKHGLLLFVIYAGYLYVLSNISLSF